MFNWLKSLFKVPEPAGPPQELKAYTANDSTISGDCISIEGDVWRVECKEKRTIQLFEFADPNIEQCIITYRAGLKSENLKGRAYLEMWCRIPERGEFFSKGLNNTINGTNDWASYEIPFYLKQNQKPDLIKLNLAIEGTGTVWIRDVQLLWTPLK